MAYNNPYLYGYNYNPYQYSYQQPLQPQQMQQPTGQQLTPPTIHAEIIQVENETAAVKFPVGAGQSQMLMTRDESAIFIKSALANGQEDIVVYQRQEPKPAKPEINLSDYVTRDEFEKRLSALINQATQQPTAATKRPAKKDETE